jgi:hypothetical protein
MSAVAMSQVAFSRVDGTPPSPPSGAGGVNERAHQTEMPNNALTDALGAIVAYFPTEVNVLYTAVLAAIVKPDTSSLAGQWLAYWLTLGAAPVVAWLLFAARLRANGMKLPLAPAKWPFLEMVFSVVAFATWGAALPGTPWAEHDWYTASLAGVAVLVVTTGLGSIAPVFGKKIDAPPPS